MKQSYVFLADGFEEVEAMNPVDILRRADIPVTTVSINNTLSVSGAHGVTVNADILFSDADLSNAEWLILPGGMPGASNLYGFAPLCDALRNHAAKGGKIAAICASPAIVLSQLGLLDGRRATCYPGMEGIMTGAVEHVDAPVAVDGNFVTGNGPANAMLWALTIVKHTIGIDEAEKIANDLLYYPRRDDDVDHYFG